MSLLLQRICPYHWVPCHSFLLKEFMIMNFIRAHLRKLYLHEFVLYSEPRDTKKICSDKVNKFIMSIDTLMTIWSFRSTVHSIGL